jgi:hypothetical protein
MAFGRSGSFRDSRSSTILHCARQGKITTSKPPQIAPNQPSMPPTVDPACASQYDSLDEGADEAAGKGTQKDVGGEEAEEEKKREEEVGRTLRGV